MHYTSPLSDRHKTHNRFVRESDPNANPQVRGDTPVGTIVDTWDSEGPCSISRELFVTDPVVSRGPCFVVSPWWD